MPLDILTFDVRRRQRRLILKFLFKRPEAERGIADIEDLFAVGQRIETVFQFCRIIAFHHFLIRDRFESDRADFIECYRGTGTIGDVKASFR